MSPTWSLIGAVGSIVAAVIAYAEVRYRRQRLETEALVADMSLQYLRLELQMADTMKVLSSQTSRVSPSRNTFVDVALPSSASPSAPLAPPASAPSTRDAGELIREINHGLNTPLAQIELSVTRASSGAPELVSAVNSIAMCRSVLAAYRDVASVMGQANSWDVNDLQATIRGAADVYAKQSTASRSINFQIRSPPSPRTQLSNYYLLSLVLPLLQNAVDATPRGAAISCTIDDVDGVIIAVRNAIGEGGPIELSRLRESGYTTRGEGHSGLGLTSVDTLVSRIPGGRLALDASAGMFTATITLPGLVN